MAALAGSRGPAWLCRVRERYRARWVGLIHRATRPEVFMSGQIRLGIIVPSVNSVVEAWYPRVVPEGVSVHFARMLMPAGTSPERIIELDRTDGRHAIDQLTTSPPHPIPYGPPPSTILH